MKKTSPIAIALAAVIGLGWMLIENFDALQGWLAPSRASQENIRPADTKLASGTDGDTIRIATFNIRVFGQSKLDKPQVVEVLAKIVRRFDVVAIQEVRSKQQDVLPRFIEQINAGGRKYHYLISRPLGRTNSTEQYAFVFDTQRIEYDQRFVYVVKDVGDRLHREPMVAAFRVRGPPPEEAFTFKLVNIHTDPGEVNPAKADSELNALDEVVRAVRNDGQNEDDVIVLGDLNTHARRLGQLGQVAHLAAALPYDVKTNTRQSKQYDNILYHQQATSEFTGRSGVLNMMKEYGLTLQQALQVSDHMPVWAEFSIYEGGRGIYVAGQPAMRR